MIYPFDTASYSTGLVSHAWGPTWTVQTMRDIPPSCTKHILLLQCVYSDSLHTTYICTYPQLSTTTLDSCPSAGARTWTPASPATEWFHVWHFAQDLHITSKAYATVGFPVHQLYTALLARLTMAFPWRGENHIYAPQLVNQTPRRLSSIVSCSWNI